MFNGIIYNTGKVEIIEKNRNSIFLGIRSNLRLNNKDLGTSISCNGVCLTLTKIKKGLIQICVISIITIFVNEILTIYPYERCTYFNRPN